MLMIIWFYLFILLLMSSMTSIIFSMLSLEVLSWIFILMMHSFSSFSYLLMQSYFLFLGILGSVFCVFSLVFFAFFLKMGLPPFHMWLVRVSSFLKKSVFIFLKTLNKLFPIFLISSFFLKQS